MPEEQTIKLSYDARDHQTLKLAAVISGDPNLRAWATRVLLESAPHLVTQFKSQSSPPEPGGAP